MIAYALNIALIVTLLLCAYQDFKSRLVHVLLFVVLLGLSILYNFKLDWGWTDITKSLLFLVSTLGIGFLVHSIIKKQPIQDFQKYFGLGDIIFLLVIIPLFSYINYGLFVISGILFSIVVHYLFYVLHKSQHIPLVGYLSIYLIVLAGFLFVNPSFLKIDLI